MAPPYDVAGATLSAVVFPILITALAVLAIKVGSLVALIAPGVWIIRRTADDA
jgi:type IV secretory pathway VirB3-like protein